MHISFKDPPILGKTFLIPHLMACLVKQAERSGRRRIACTRSFVEPRKSSASADERSLTKLQCNFSIRVNRCSKEKFCVNISWLRRDIASAALLLEAIQLMWFVISSNQSLAVASLAIYKTESPKCSRMNG